MNPEGTVEFLNEKGFGFLKIEGYEKNIFFHAKDLRHVRFEQLRKGDRVSVESITSDDRGHKAHQVFLIS